MITIFADGCILAGSVCLERETGAENSDNYPFVVVVKLVGQIVVVVVVVVVTRSR